VPVALERFGWLALGVRVFWQRRRRRGMRRAWHLRRARPFIITIRFTCVTVSVRKAIGSVAVTVAIVQPYDTERALKIG
jgi:hypothetical protein